MFFNKTWNYYGKKYQNIKNSFKYNIRLILKHIENFFLTDVAFFDSEPNLIEKRYQSDAKSKISTK